MPNLLQLVLLTLVAGCALAQDRPASSIKALTHESSVDEILDALDARGSGLEAFLADVSLSETDTGVGDTSTRSGKVAYQVKPGGDARIRVYFTTIDRGGKVLREQFVYMLEGGKLIERNYPGKSQVTRQVLKPGEKINLLRLGEGPFPLPIGQPREEVLKQFDVHKVGAAKDDPAGTIHIQLTPKSGTRFARQFKTVDVWVDANSHMPRRIETMDSTQTTIRTTDLQNVQVNPTLTDADFALEKIDQKDWNLVEEKYED